MKKVALLLTLVLMAANLSAQPSWIRDSVKGAYLRLEFTRGNTLLAAHADAGSVGYIRLVSLRDFLTSLLWQTRAGVEKFNLKSDYWHSRLEGDRSADPSAVAARIEVSLYKAVLSSQISDYRSSATSLMKAYKDFAKNSSRLSRGDLDKLSGIMGVLFSQVPDQALKFLKVAGIRPELLSGFDGLDRYYRESSKGSADRLEGVLLMITALKEFSGDPSASWKYALEHRGEYDLNPLVRYQSALAALKSGNAGVAAAMLELVAGAKAPFPTWYYQLGRCYQLAMKSGSDPYFMKFLNSENVDVYHHAARLRLAWNCILRDDKEGAGRYFSEIRKLPEPLTVYDKQALREAEGQGLPDRNLLKIRILFDGGAYQACVTEAEAIERSVSLPDASRAEVLYRKARCFQRLGNQEEAIRIFQRVLEFDGRIKSYLLPNSALQLGYLYKETGQLELARKYLNKCIELNHYEFRDGINRQAQAALRELR